MCLVLLEIGLRIGGLVFLSLQEHRNKTALKQKDTYRILCLGESTTALGWGDSYPSQLERILNQHSTGIKFSVINKGVPGTNTTRIVANVEDYLNQYNPHLVITMMGINDNLETIDYDDGHFTKLRIYTLAKFFQKRLVDKFQEIIPRIAITINARDDKAYIQLARYYEGKHVWDSSELPRVRELLQKALAMNPKNVEAYLELMEYHREYHEYAQLDELVKKTLRVGLENAAVYVELAGYYRDAGDLERSAEFLRKALAIDPENDDAYFALAEYCFARGEAGEVVELLKKALEINPKNQDAYMGLVGYYCDTGQYDQKEKLLKKVLAVNPQGREAYMGLAAFLCGRSKDDPSKEPDYWESFRFESGHYDPRCPRDGTELIIGRGNYERLKKTLDRRGITLVAVQYPMRNIETLKATFEDQDGIIFVDNENVFREAVRQGNYDEYFGDKFACNFGHCTPKGNKLLAENIASVIWKLIQETVKASK